MKLKNKVALITGGSLGLGKSTAILFVKEGAKVVITGRTEKTLKETVGEAKKEGLEIDYIVSDVAKEEDCKEAVDYTVNKYGRIDILFNNAGVLYVATTHETSTEIWDETFNINVRGTYLMSKYTIPHMLKQGKGCIVNNSSILGLKAVPGVAAYNATKGAITQLTRSMALEYADKGIRVNAICPGTIVTPMVEGLFDQMENRKSAEELFKSFHPMGRLGRPEEIAHAVLFLCDDNVEFMTGSMLSVDGGWVAK
ncbi:MAG TPA: SDR family oxidoreductase [Thermodesulfobacteriota bacterium]|nr:SDR family oxidoreductase [Thermodesulfobacteriota bacterium]